MSKIINKKKITFICDDDEMYEGLMGIVSDIREEVEEDIEGAVGLIEETDNEIVITLNKKVE